MSNVSSVQLRADVEAGRVHGKRDASKLGVERRQLLAGRGFELSELTSECDDGVPQSQQATVVHRQVVTQ